MTFCNPFWIEHTFNRRVEKFNPKCLTVYKYRTHTNKVAILFVSTELIVFVYVYVHCSLLCVYGMVFSVCVFPMLAFCSVFVFFWKRNSINFSQQNRSHLELNFTGTTPKNNPKTICRGPFPKQQQKESPKQTHTHRLQMNTR